MGFLTLNTFCPFSWRTFVLLLCTILSYQIVNFFFLIKKLYSFDSSNLKSFKNNESMQPFAAKHIESQFAPFLISSTYS